MKYKELKKFLLYVKNQEKSKILVEKIFLETLLEEFLSFHRKNATMIRKNMCQKNSTIK